jgi:hypothetical protein
MMEDLNLDLMFDAIGLKELILGVIVVVFLYMVWLMVRMVRLSMGTKSDDLDSLNLPIRQPVNQSSASTGSTAPQSSSSSWSSTPETGLKSFVNSIFGGEEPDPKEILEREKRAALYAEVGSNLRMRGGVPIPKSTAGTRNAAGAEGVAVPVVNDRVASSSNSVLADPRVQTMAKELENMRGEVKELKKNLSSLQNQWQEEINQVQISQNTAPIYSDAMHLASQGLNASDIAERCDIPLGEATLVVALAGKKRRA